MSNFQVIAGTITGPNGHPFVVNDVVSADDLKTVGVDRAVALRVVKETDQERRVMHEKFPEAAVLLASELPLAQGAEPPPTASMPLPAELGVASDGNARKVTR